MIEERRKCPKCGGLFILDETWDKNGEHCKFRRCLNCGDVDFDNGTYHRKILKRIKAITEKMDPLGVPRCLQSEKSE
jgi:uncharacterized Zn finger protein